MRCNLDCSALLASANRRSIWPVGGSRPGRGARYYSLSITEEEEREALEEGEKPVPTARVKLYQFRQQDGRDPDYASPEPFNLNGALYWGLFWIVLPEDFPADPSEQDLQRVVHALIFSDTRPVEKWEKGLMRDMEAAQTFLRGSDAVSWRQGACFMPAV